MRIGYARVSTEDQKMDLQLNALGEAGCDHVFTDHGVSGAGFERPGLEDVMKALQRGDTLVVWRLDRLGRSLVRLVQFVDELGKRGIEFRSLSENIDTTSSGGRLVFHLIAALSEFERALISERTRAGMDAARRKGLHLGRRPVLTTQQQKAAYRAVRVDGQTIPAVAKHYNVDPRTIRRIVNQKEAKARTE
ncbi:recombinase family protein [Rhizobium rhizogenes]|uniref:recombinase family protein n=1 Tax=Rhizobium rhizogenes TaxID=359 RepID=UPI00055ED71A|nr:recombinase family protein [Rhizobium rhizogenes]NTF83806.1 recombinase family protein [Rhizobium rhizogenes]NTH79857.1 recombinase family protein [Rhizobium rhizogenes]NTH85834.1 recombinase family protein [Rhizobium rhizogenes]NTI25082.1 recombinase family protein [Rhizobium rhizogenes]QTG07912.1 recombinase family protein [Rhizobium rhizogenes]